MPFKSRPVQTGLSCFSQRNVGKNDAKSMTTSPMIFKTNQSLFFSLLKTGKKFPMSLLINSQRMAILSWAKAIKNAVGKTQNDFQCMLQLIKLYIGRKKEDKMSRIFLTG